jgi:F-type H+-transporting ATPase subunit gamma
MFLHCQYGPCAAVQKRNHDSVLGKDYQVVALGEKVRKGLERLFGKTMTVGVSENGRLKPPTFRQVSLIADHVTSHEYKKSVFIYQYFRSMVAYDTTSKLSVSYDEMVADHKDKFYGYKIAGTPDTLKNMQEFSVALNLQLFFAETETSTLSSRMTAMDNSSNNAGDMLNALNLLLNRNRQARITTELTEIISGAAAVEDA